MKRCIALITSVLLIIGLFSGCAEDPGVYVPTGDALVMEDGVPVQPTPPQTESEQKLTLTYYPDRSMNPLICTDFTNRVVFSLLYQSLFVVDRDYNPAPMLCKQYSVSQDMRTYTFYLEAATFSDGTPLTAQDVVASLEAARQNTYYAGRFQHFSGATVTSDGAVMIRTDTPMENLPLLLDIPIVKASQIQDTHPLGTGPYTMENITGNALLRRRKDWWCRADMTATAPAIALIVAESNTQIRDEFEFGDLDLVCANPGSDRYADYRCDFELWDCETGIFLYLSCNMNSPIFSNQKVRSTLTYAIDRDTIAANNYRGFAQSASLPASPKSPYYRQAQAARYAYNGGIAFHQAVADAGLVGSQLTLLVNSEDTMRVRIARSIAQTLTAAGFVVQLKACSGTEYRQSLQRGSYDLFLGQTRLSPNMDLTPFFSSTGSLRYGGLNDVALHSLCLEALANHGNYYTLHQAIMDDGRLCPILFSSYAVYATRGLVTALTPSRDNVFFYTLGKTMSDARID